MKNKTLHPRINQVKWEEKETHGYTKKKWWQRHWLGYDKPMAFHAKEKTLWAEQC